MTEHLSPADLDRLEAVAAAATPGRWRSQDFDEEEACTCILGDTSDAMKEHLIALTPEWPAGATQADADAEHIAEFDPPTVQALISMARVGARALDRDAVIAALLDVPIAGGGMIQMGSNVPDDVADAGELADALIASLTAPDTEETP